MSEPKNGFGFDEEFEALDNEFTLLPDGECFFAITKMKREYKPVGKFGTVHVAIMSFLCCTADEQEASVDVQFPLCAEMGWKTLALATSVGLRQHGDESKKIKPEWWGKFVGLSGKCMMGSRTFKGKDGTDKTCNDIKSFLDAESGPSFD